MEDAQTSSPACHRSKNVSSQKCTTCLREGENWGMAGCKDCVHQKRIPARASCFLKRKWMTQWPFGEVLCLKGLRCHQGHIRPSAKRCIAHSVRLQFMLKCAENSRRLCSGCGKKSSNGYGGQEFPIVFSADPRTREYSWTVRFSLYSKTRKLGELMA